MGFVQDVYPSRGTVLVRCWARTGEKETKILNLEFLPEELSVEKDHQ